MRLRSRRMAVGARRDDGASRYGLMRLSCACGAPLLLAGCRSCTRNWGRSSGQSRHLHNRRLCKSTCSSAPTLLCSSIKHHWCFVPYPTSLPLLTRRRNGGPKRAPVSSAPALLTGTSAQTLRVAYRLFLAADDTLKLPPVLTFCTASRPMLPDAASRRASILRILPSTPTDRHRFCSLPSLSFLCLFS